MKANKTNEEKLRNVTKKTQGGKKMRKKKTIIKKKKKQNKITNIFKDTVPFLDYLLQRNVRFVKQDEEDPEIPKHPCISCRYYVNGRCQIHGRPILEPMSTKCFKHSLYPSQEQIYLAFERIDANVLKLLTDVVLEDVS